MIAHLCVRTIGKPANNDIKNNLYASLSKWISMQKKIDGYDKWAQGNNDDNWDEIQLS